MIRIPPMSVVLVNSASVLMWTYLPSMPIESGTGSGIGANKAVAAIFPIAVGVRSHAGPLQLAATLTRKLRIWINTFVRLIGYCHPGESDSHPPRLTPLVCRLDERRAWR